MYKHFVISLEGRRQPEEKVILSLSSHRLVPLEPITMYTLPMLRVFMEQ